MCGGGTGGGGQVGLKPSFGVFSNRNAGGGEPATETPANALRKLFSAAGASIPELEPEEAPRKKLTEIFDGIRGATALTTPTPPAEPQAGKPAATPATGSKASTATTELTGAGGVPRNKHTLGKATVLGS